MELSELIESVDILEYISQYTEFTEKNGEYWGLSPLKEEKTPSFSIRKEENNFYDFSSGVGGERSDVHPILQQVWIPKGNSRFEGVCWL